MSSDTLSTTSRNFYENAKSKLSYSLVLGAAALMLIGFSSFTGGLSKYYDIQADHSSPSYVEDINKSLSAGYGIACFVHLVGFFLIVIAAFVASPLIFGSANEKKVLRTPQEIEASAFQPSATSPAV